MFFSEEKNQKTFARCRGFILLSDSTISAGRNRDSDIKVFCFFSSEKKISCSATFGQCH